MSTEIEGTARCTRIMFPKSRESDGGFTIARFITSSIDMPNSFTIKGEFYVEEGGDYKIHAIFDEESSKTFSNSYTSVSVRKDIELNVESRDSVESFLYGVMTESVANMLVQLDDPITALENSDIETLTTIKGMGASKAQKAIDIYFSQKDFTEAFTKLSKYNFTPKALQKIIRHFQSPDRAVKLILENPYVLTEVDGYGFKKADDIFMLDNKPTDLRRVEAYIKHIFEEENGMGNSWITPQAFIAKIQDFFPNSPAELYKHAGNHVTTDEQYIYIDDHNGKRITTRYMYDVERQIVSEFKRLLNADCTMDLADMDKHIAETEKQNGWKYDKSQRKAQKDMVEQNVFMLQGLAGTGKSSVVKGFLNGVSKSGYNFGQCALAGKAADNLTKVTGQQGYTIHSLIGAMPGSEPKHNRQNPLSYNVIVVDEISMPNAEIFLQLLRAIPSGSKLIMLGDFGQLDPIGVGVMAGMIKSGVIPNTLLDTIHRQAEDSAIITHSFSLRNGRTPNDLDLRKGTDVYGVKEDLEYVIVDNAFEHQILDEAIDKFKERLQNYSVEDIQILCSTRASGKVSTFDLNIKAQSVYNPLTPSNIGVKRVLGKNEFYIRVGDKVLNTANNKDTFSPENEVRPIYNGNTGVVVNIDYDVEGNDHDLTVNFDGIGEVVVSGNTINNLELGYAITVHKSQGSTIKSVIFAMPFHYMLNSRELAYTAMTRASEDLVFLTSAKSFRHAAKTTKAKTKQTNLEFLLVEAFK